MVEKKNFFSWNYQFLIIGRGAWGKEYDLIGNLWGPLPRRLESCESDPYISFPKFGGGGGLVCEGFGNLLFITLHYITLHGDYFFLLFPFRLWETMWEDKPIVKTNFKLVIPTCCMNEARPTVRCNTAENPLCFSCVVFRAWSALVSKIF